MSYTNTTSSQDKEIQDAESAPHISNLVAIIAGMDDEISEWKSAGDCDDPTALEDKLDAQKAEIERLEKELKESRDLYEANHG